jgi:hypothetical protein
MKTYKDFGKEYIGCSDIASLIMVGCRGREGLKTEALRFGEDGCYKAYVIHQAEDEEIKIESHYTKVATFNHWLKLYDDDGLTFKTTAKEINIYRGGDFGCIIQVIQ